jgi:hypothetical protein
LSGNPTNPYGDKAIGLAVLSSVVFCTTTGLGVGAFVGEPLIGGVAGGVTGIVSGVALIPALMRDWR